MKTPDKIYAMIVAGTLYADTKQHEEFNKPYAEYIRKDALVEMLKGYSHPLTRAVVQELIDKINSL